MRSSPRSGTDGGGPIRSASTAGLGRCGRAGRNAPFRPAEKRGRGALRLRFMTEQPPYSLLARGIDSDVLPVAEQFGMGVLPWLLARRSRSRLATSWIMETIHRMYGIRCRTAPFRLHGPGDRRHMTNRLVCLGAPSGQ